MTKVWVQTEESAFVFFVDGIEIGTYRRGDEQKKKPPQFNILDENYTITLMVGAYIKPYLKILNSLKECVLKIRSLNCISNCLFVLDYKEFKLILTTDPYWRWTIKENERQIISYATNLSKKPFELLIESSTQNHEDNYLFDFLLGHLVLGKKAESFLG